MPYRTQRLVPPKAPKYKWKIKLRDLSQTPDSANLAAMIFYGVAALTCFVLGLVSNNPVFSIPSCLYGLISAEGLRTFYSIQKVEVPEP